MRQYHLLLFYMALFWINAVAGQERVVTGTVVSPGESENPVPGVNIKIQGKESGVITDAKGQFRIVMPADTGTLIFTHVGYITKTENVKGSGTLKIVFRTCI